MTIILIIATALVIGLMFTFFGLASLSKASDANTSAGDKQRLNSASKICAFISAICFATAVLIPIGLPQYRVWEQNKAGEAELARAEQNRKITVEEAKAKEEAAKSLAAAEVIRAQGVAQANRIIGDSLQNNDAYIHYLWVEALRESSNEVIYIPTEAGIPITESARLSRKE